MAEGFQRHAQLERSRPVRHLARGLNIHGKISASIFDEVTPQVRASAVQLINLLRSQQRSDRARNRKVPLEKRDAEPVRVSLCTLLNDACAWYESMSKVRGQSIAQRTGVKRMPDWYRRRCREAQGAAPTCTASTTSAVVARRIARRPCFCAELELAFLSWVLLPTGFFLGILNSRTAPL